uniref:MAM domain-containing protein n=1 Tax=Timema cristinae TaxID=61476 RepID=A0A7R9DCQ9_TIMCR|nr:unnamed protein product [Timema cristinae]
MATVTRATELVLLPQDTRHRYIYETSSSERGLAQKHKKRRTRNKEERDGVVTQQVETSTSSVNDLEQHFSNTLPSRTATSQSSQHASGEIKVQSVALFTQYARNFYRDICDFGSENDLITCDWVNRNGSSLQWQAGAGTLANWLGGPTVDAGSGDDSERGFVGRVNSLVALRTGLEDLLMGEYRKYGSSCFRYTCPKLLQVASMLAALRHSPFLLGWQ